MTRRDIARLLAAARDHAPHRSDADIAEKLQDEGELAIATAPPKLQVPAAVLVPLVDRPAGFSVLLTRRTAHLANHAGQVSFPGGRIEEGDSDATSAALRETEEEIGLAADHIDVLGRLDDYVTTTGFRVTPVVAAVTPGFHLTPDAYEVAEIFEVPLAFVLDRSNHQRHSRVYQGKTRHFYAMPYGEHYIWGATAAMLINLCDALTGA